MTLLRWVSLIFHWFPYHQAYLGLVTVLLTQTATNFCTNSFKAHGGSLVLKDYKQSAYNAAAAGSVLLCIVNYALIIFVGLGAAAAQVGLSFSKPNNMSWA